MSDIHVSFGESIDADMVDTHRIEMLVRSILETEKVDWSSVGIILTGHEQVHELNRQYLQHDYVTDVLSFLIDESGDGIEGEVYVDVETAAERHVEFSVTLREEIERYIVHGVLHLAGHDDDTKEQKDRMHELESQYLRRLG